MNTATIIALATFALALLAHTVGLIKLATRFGMWAGELKTIVAEHERRLTEGGL